MKAALAVSPTAGPAAASSTHKMTAEEMDKSYMDGVKAFPAKTKGQGNVDLQPKIENGVKVYDITAANIDWEVAPGDIRKGMAYNGMIPGPVIRANVGDKVKIVLHNKLDESTAMHFHGLVVPNSQDGVPGVTQPLVKPGETFTYEFTVKNSGSHMYHSHMNGALQIPSGLLGAFIVAGADEPKVAREELMILNDGPLGYTINGKGFPATAPIVAKQGERIRVRYMNEGLQIHPMHLHGIVQTVFAKDGYPIPQPYKADTVLVAPGERVDVLIEATDLGLWAFHCHILTHAESEAGMFGMVTVMIVQ
ncbi:MAG: copper oxidase [Dehalococcoidia bacterium]|nr:MAG: copper oxidase [Dehalococcoidia bacterium]